MVVSSSCASRRPADADAVIQRRAQPLDVSIKIAPLSCTAMDRIKFETVVSGGDGDYSHIWDFDAADGYSVDGFEPVAYNIYPEAGSYIASVHVADGSGAIGEASIEIDVTAREYTSHDPIELRDQTFPRDNPHVIDGYDITNPDGNGITLLHCDNIIIRNCYIHDCKEGKERGGRAVYTEGCHNVTVQNVYVKDNDRGIMMAGYPDGPSGKLLVENCVVVGSKVEDAVSFRNVEDVEVSGNILYDNGKIWDNRISGISFNGTYRNLSVHNNLVVRSNSDGIELLGEDDQEIPSGMEIYSNVLRDSGEQGVWLFRAKDCRVHHNYIEGVHNNGVCMEGWGSGVKIDHNIIVRCGGTPDMKHYGGAGIAFQCSRDSIIQNNIVVDGFCGEITIASLDRTDHKTKGMDERFLTSAGNIIDGNVLYGSECNISIGNEISPVSIKNNVLCRHDGGDFYRGCKPDESNVKAKPLFRSPERGDYRLLSNSPGYSSLKEVSPPTVSWDWHFGTLVFDYKYVPLIMSEENISEGFEKEARAAAEAGAYWARPHLTELFAWGVTEKQPGEYDWAVIDLAVKKCQKYNLHLLPQLWTISNWDQDLPPGDMSNAMDALFSLKKWPWTRGESLKPKNMKAYLAWLKAMVKRYDGDGVGDMTGLKYPVMYYEILNEPQGIEDMEPFFAVQKASFTAIKEENPDIQMDISAPAAVVTDLIPESIDGGFSSREVKADGTGLSLQVGKNPVMIEAK